MLFDALFKIIRLADVNFTRMLISQNVNCKHTNRLKVRQLTDLPIELYPHLSETGIKLYLNYTLTSIRLFFHLTFSPQRL